MENKTIKYSVLIFGIACIFAGVASCLFERVAGGGVVIATGLILFLLSQFEIEYFKILGLEAKLRKTIDEAEVTLEALRKITVPISEISVSLAARTGRLGVASSNKELHDLSMRIRDELLEIKVSNDDINKVLHDWYFYTAFDMGMIVTNLFMKRLDDKQRKFQQNVDDWVDNKPISDQVRFAELLEPVRIAGREIKEARDCLWKKNYQDIPEIIRGCITKSITLNESEKNSLWSEIDDQWQDLTHFVQEKQLRRSDKWFATDV